MLGALQLNGPGQEPRTLALLQEFTPNAGTAWQLTTSRLEAFFEEAGAQAERALTELAAGPWTVLAQAMPPPVLAELVGPYLSQATLLGVRTAEVHLILASGSDAAFAPETFSTLHQQSIYQRAQKTGRRINASTSASAMRCSRSYGRATCCGYMTRSQSWLGFSGA